MADLPYSPTAERVALAFALADPNGWNQLQAWGLRDDHFHLNFNKAIAQAIRTLVDQNVPISRQTVEDKLRTQGLLDFIGGSAFINSFGDVATEDIVMVEHFSGDLQKYAVRRKVIEDCALAINRARNIDEPIEAIVSDFENTAMHWSATGHRAPTTAEALEGVSRTIELARRGLGGYSNISFIPPLDSLIQGFRSNDFVIWAAPPGSGKSSAMRFSFYKRVSQAIERRTGAFIISLEETEEEMFESLVSLETRIPNDYFTNPALARTLTPAQLESIEQAKIKIRGLPIFIETIARPTTAAIASRARMYQLKCQREFGVPLTCMGLDYIQKMVRSNGKDQSGRSASLADISADLRAMAMPDELGIEVHVAAQLNREGKKSEEPNMAHLAESASLENDATKIIIMYKSPIPEEDLIVFPQNRNPDGSMKKKYPVEQMTFKVVKVRRGGGVGKVECNWDKSMNRYFEGTAG